MLALDAFSNTATERRGYSLTMRLQKAPLINPNLAEYHAIALTTRLRVLLSRPDLSWAQLDVPDYFLACRIISLAN